MPVFVMLLMIVAATIGFHAVAYANWVVSGLSAVIVVVLVVFAVCALLSFALNKFNDAREDY